MATFTLTAAVTATDRRGSSTDPGASPAPKDPGVHAVTSRTRCGPPGPPALGKRHPRSPAGRSGHPAAT
eukprot:7630160-Heterocapsa_arctica.AAC.1